MLREGQQDALSLAKELAVALARVCVHYSRVCVGDWVDVERVPRSFVDRPVQVARVFRGVLCGLVHHLVRHIDEILDVALGVFFGVLQSLPPNSRFSF